jgi:hypothetical protein
MRDGEMYQWDRDHPARRLDPLVEGWRALHPGGSLEDLVRDLGLWHKPKDRDAQWLAWQALKRTGDRIALEGFPAARNAGRDIVPAVRDAGSRRSSPRDGAATGCSAETRRPAESTA